MNAASPNPRPPNSYEPRPHPQSGTAEIPKPKLYIARGTSRDGPCISQASSNAKAAFPRMLKGLGFRVKVLGFTACWVEGFRLPFQRY